MNKHIDNKGFTLIELLSVIVILISVSFVAVSGITSSLERRDEKEYEEQQELAIGAAKIYFSLNNKTCVKIQTLIDDNYINNDKKVSRLNKNYTIRLNGNSYNYSGMDCS